jgi:hypothetical protein
MAARKSGAIHFITGLNARKALNHFGRPRAFHLEGIRG